MVPFQDKDKNKVNIKDKDKDKDKNPRKSTWTLQPHTYNNSSNHTYSSNNNNDNNNDNAASSWYVRYHNNITAITIPTTMAVWQSPDSWHTSTFSACQPRIALMSQHFFRWCGANKTLLQYLLEQSTSIIYQRCFYTWLRRPSLPSLRLRTTIYDSFTFLLRGGTWWVRHRDGTVSRAWSPRHSPSWVVQRIKVLVHLYVTTSSYLQYLKYLVVADNDNMFRFKDTVVAAERDWDCRYCRMFSHVMIVAACSNFIDPNHQEYWWDMDRYYYDVSWSRLMYNRHWYKLVDTARRRL